VKCPDGTTRTVHRKIDDAFPLNIQASQGRFSAAVRDGAGVVSANIQAEHRSKVEQLLVEIDSKNNTLMVKFRAAYLVYMTNPCAKGEYLADRVAQLITMHDRLTEAELSTQGLIALIKSSPNETEAILKLFREIVNKLGPVSPELSNEAAKIAIDSARQDAEDWLKAGGAANEGLKQ
jgi:hypothetical protein